MSLVEGWSWEAVMFNSLQFWAYNTGDKVASSSKKKSCIKEIQALVARYLASKFLGAKGWRYRRASTMLAIQIFVYYHNSEGMALEEQR